jgi:D-sedoheptulose 7-phosphate isomerase
MTGDVNPDAGRNYEDVVRQHFLESARVKRDIADDLAGPGAQAARHIAGALLDGHKVLVFGNGGSAADAQHFAGEMVGRFKMPSRAALPVIALTTDSTVLTCIANDFSYEEVFSRQIEAFAQPGDVVVGISTSGRSPNVLRALRSARERSAYTIALLGNDGGAAAGEADCAIVVPTDDTTRIQECHITLIHSICELIEIIYRSKDVANR